MPRSYRVDYAALGLALGISLTFNVLAWLSVGWDWLDLKEASPESGSYAEQQCTRQQAEHSARPSAILGGDQTGAAKVDTEQANRAENNEPDWCDLAAQQSMADSTFWMMKSAWVAVFLTGIGVILLYRTLYYTRETLKEAQETTNAANAQASVAEKALLVADRPYMFVENIIAHDKFPRDYSDMEDIPAGEFRITYDIINHGRTPAIMSELRVALYFGNALPPEPKWLGGGVHFDEIVIEPRGGKTFSEFYRGTITAEMLAELWMSQTHMPGHVPTHIYFYAYLKYQGVTGTEDEVGVIFEYRPHAHIFMRREIEGYTYRRLGMAPLAEKQR